MSKPAGTKPINLNIPDYLKREIQLEALEFQTTLTQIVIQALIDRPSVRLLKRNVPETTLKM